MGLSWYLVKAYQIFDYVLVVLILSGKKIGPMLLLFETLLIILLQIVALNPIMDKLINQTDDVKLNILR